MSSLAPLAAGDVIDGDFEIERLLGEGGMGAVYVATQKSTGKRRALKTMHPGIISDAGLRKRFEREAKVGAQIESEHLVEVVAAGVDEARRIPYLVMELLDGEDLCTRIETRGPRAPEEVRVVFEQLCHAVGAAHDAGVVHRDLKPENVFLARSRRADTGPYTVKVLDFGIAKILAEADTRVTRGAVGSPQWMAPEQTSPGAVTAEADVWALGLLAFELLTGRSFWRAVSGGGGTAAQLLREIVLDPIPLASARAADLGLASRIPPGFDAWFSRCVAREPSARFKDANLAWRALDKVLRGGDDALADTSEVTSDATAYAGTGAGPLVSSPPAAADAVSAPPFRAASDAPPIATPADVARPRAGGDTTAPPASRRQSTDGTPPPAERDRTVAAAPAAPVRPVWIVAGAIVVAGIAVGVGLSRKGQAPVSASALASASASAPALASASALASAPALAPASASAPAHALAPPSAHAPALASARALAPPSAHAPALASAHAPALASARAPASATALSGGFSNPTEHGGPASWTMKDGRHVRLLARVASNGSNVTDAVVKSAIEWSAWEYLRCYERAFGTLKDQPEGVIVVDYEIIDQLPRHAKLKSSTFKNAAIDSCVVGTLVGHTINAAGPNGRGPASHAFRFVPMN